MNLLLVGEQVGKDLMEDLDSLVDSAIEFATGGILMPATAEVTRTDVAHREVAL